MFLFRISDGGPQRLSGRHQGVETALVLTRPGHGPHDDTAGQVRVSNQSKFLCLCLTFCVVDFVVVVWFIFLACCACRVIHHTHTH